MHPQVRSLFDTVSSALLQERLDTMRRTSATAIDFYDAQGHAVTVTRASVLAELAMREQEEQLPF